MSVASPASLLARHRDLGVEVTGPIGGEIRLSVGSKQAGKLFARLRDEDDSSMKRLVDLTAIDRGVQAGHGAGQTDGLGGAGGAGGVGDENTGTCARFEVVYRLHSIERDARLRVHVRVESEGAESAGAQPVVDSVTKLWPSANWLEREVFDLFGIRFKGHPDLRRILLDEAFEGAPLRKDHPLRQSRPLPEEGEA